MDRDSRRQDRIPWERHLLHQLINQIFYCFFWLIRWRKRCHLSKESHLLLFLAHHLLVFYYSSNNKRENEKVMMPKKKMPGNVVQRSLYSFLLLWRPADGWLRAATRKQETTGQSFPVIIFLIVLFLYIILEIFQNIFLWTNNLKTGKWKISG